MTTRRHARTSDNVRFRISGALTLALSGLALYAPAGCAADRNSTSANAQPDRSLYEGFGAGDALGTYLHQTHQAVLARTHTAKNAPEIATYPDNE